MNLSLFEKFGIIFDYMFSSFLSIGMFILTLLLLCILLVNLKVKNKYINIVSIGVFLGFALGILISYGDYVQLCINGFVKAILNYIYFPSAFIYFLIFAFITILMIRTIFSKKMKMFKKVINYIWFSILYFLFMSFIVLCVYSGVDIYDSVKLYQNDIILSIVQISNLLFVVWIIISSFYELYQFYKKKFD